MANQFRNKLTISEEVDSRFKHYPPRNEKEIKTHEYIRNLFKTFAHDLIQTLPESIVLSREFAMVLTDLENGMMHANAAFARHKPIESEMNPIDDKK